jgi:hypothetical protein
MREELVRFFRFFSDIRHMHQGLQAHAVATLRDWLSGPPPSLLPPASVNHPSLHSISFCSSHHH